MTEQKMTLAALAEIGAMRRLIVQALALRLLEEETPQHALMMLGMQLMETRTTPAETTNDLDPAVSDLLAAMTDESLQGLLQDLTRAVKNLTGESASLAV